MLKKNFSFVVPKRLAGMRFPGRNYDLPEDLEFLQEQGISAIVTLTEERLNKNILEQYGMEWTHIPIPDFHPPELSQILELVEFIDKMNEQGKGVAVHCHAGIGRTGTMLACYLVRLGRTPEQAIYEVRDLRPGSIETSEQEEAIYNYARFLDENKKKS